MSCTEGDSERMAVADREVFFKGLFDAGPFDNGTGVAMATLTACREESRRFIDAIEDDRDARLEFKNGMSLSPLYKGERRVTKISGKGFVASEAVPAKGVKVLFHKDMVAINFNRDAGAPFLVCYRTTDGTPKHGGAGADE